MNLDGVALGTYIGSGTAPDGAEVSYTLRLMTKKMAWLDYKAEKPPRDVESWHSEGQFAFSSGEAGMPLVRFTIGGLPGQFRVGEVFEFRAEPLPGKKSHVLRCQGITLQPQSDTLDNPNGDKVCDICGQPILKQAMKLGDKYFHKECFVCKTCGSPLSGQFQTQSDGSRICMTCVPTKICEACKKEINGQATEYDGNLYHPECFGCEECGEPFTGSVYKKKGRLLCKACTAPKSPNARSKAKANSSEPASPEAQTPSEESITPKPTSAATQAEAASPPKAPKASAPSPPPEKPKVKLTSGCYNGILPRQDESGAEVAFSIRIMDDNVCWLDKTSTTKISTSSWHAEGTFVEQLDPWCIRFTVESHPYGGGPDVGTIYEMKVASEGKREVIVCEDVRCVFQADAMDLTAEEYMAEVELGVKEPPKPVRKPAVAKKIEPLPGEGAATRLMQGGAGVMERTEIDTSNSIVKGPRAPRAEATKAATTPPAAAAKDPEPAAAVTAPAAAVPAPAASAPAASDGFLSLEDLQNRDAWTAKGVDATKREEYLSDADFMTAFGISKTDFAKMPKWKRDGRKREIGLF